MLFGVQRKLNVAPAGGLDSWRPAGIEQRPKQILGCLAQVFNVSEGTGEWPKALCSAGVTMIPKGEGIARLDKKTCDSFCNRTQDVGSEQVERQHSLARGVDNEGAARLDSYMERRASFFE